MVYWQPPKEALEKVKELVSETLISRYGNDEGIPELRAALVKRNMLIDHNSSSSFFFMMSVIYCRCIIHSKS